MAVGVRCGHFRGALFLRPNLQRPCRVEVALASESSAWASAGHPTPLVEARHQVIEHRTLQRAHIAAILGKKPPFAARNWLKVLRGLMAVAVNAGLRADDPTQGVRLPKPKAGEIHPWTEDEIAQFEAYHPVGDVARLALALLLYTAQRRGDVVRMGRQHVKDGVLSLRQEKTGTFVEIPVHPALASIIAETPITGEVTFLTSVTGAAFSSAGFGNVFREWCDEADLPKRCSSHGLRKAACRRLAEAGCSEHEIAAISGHESLAEVRRYTRAASRARMAKSAMATVTAAFPRTAKDEIGNRDLQPCQKNLQTFH